MNIIKRFIKTAGIYFIGSILTKVISFFLLPLYTAKIRPEQFGDYDLIIAIISFVVPVVFFQVWDGMFRFAFDKEKNNEKYSVISDSFSVFIFSIVIFTILYYMVANVINFNYRNLIYIYSIAFALQYQYTYIARSFLDNQLFVVSGLINTIVSALVNVTLIVKFNFGVESLYIASILGIILQVLIIEIKLQPLKNITFKTINKSKLIELIKFSFPLCIATISYWLLTGYTKISITKELGSYENGLYSVASRFSVTISLVVSIFQYAWNEVAYLISGDDDRMTKYTFSIQYIFRIVIMGSSIFILIIKLIFPYLINNMYKGALQIIPLSLIGVAFNSLAGFVSTIFMTEKQTKYILWTTIVSSLINILLLKIFISIWGLQGATLALCLSFGILAFLRIYYINKVFEISPSFSFSICIIMIAFSLYVFYVVDNIFIVVMSIIILTILALYNLRKVIYPLVSSIIKREGVRI